MEKVDVETAVGRLFKLLIDKKILTEDEIMKLLKKDKNTLPKVTLNNALNLIHGLECRIIEQEQKLNLLKFEHDKTKHIIKNLK
jgi:hypothetical protein